MKEKIIVVESAYPTYAERNYEFHKHMYEKQRRDYPKLVPFEDNPFYSHDLSDYA